MTRRVLTAALAAVLLALPACGGDDQALPGDQDFPPTETGVVPPGGFTEDEIELAIEDYDAADIIGTAVLSPDNAATRILVQLDVYPDEGGSAEIREGRCEAPEGEVVHELGELQDGRTEETVDTSLEDLMAADHALFAVGPDGGDLGCALIAAFGVDLD